MNILPTELTHISTDLLQYDDSPQIEVSLESWIDKQHSPWPEDPPQPDPDAGELRLALTSGSMLVPFAFGALLAWWV